MSTRYSPANRISVISVCADRLHRYVTLLRDHSYDVVPYLAVTPSVTPSLLRGLEGVAVMPLEGRDAHDVEVLRTVRQQSPLVRAIVVAPATTTALLKTALNLGAFAFVEDSDGPETLLAHVRRAVQEVTNRRIAEIELHQTQAELTRLSHLSTLTEISSGVAHEVNQPLAAICSFAGACSRMIKTNGVREISEDQVGQLQQWLADIGDQALRCGAVIKRLRDLVRRVETHRAPVGVNELVRASIDHMEQNRSIQRATPIVWTEQEPNPIVFANRVELKQAIVNLLTNATEAISEDDSSDPQIVVTASVHGDSVRLSVEDHGPGLSAHQHRVFDPFFSTKSLRIGLGLNSCRSIIESHDGRLWAESASPRGARFHIELPIVPTSQLTPAVA